MAPGEISLLKEVDSQATVKVGRLWCRCLVRLELRLGCRLVSNVKLATLGHEHRKGARPRRPSWGRSRAGPGRLPPRQGLWGVQVFPLSHARSLRVKLVGPGACSSGLG